jgi:hypothetical protein
MIESLRLCEYPGKTVRLSCEKCGRQGQYPRGTLIAIHGANIPLPDLLIAIARCHQRGKMHDACAVRYPDLIPTH